MSQRRAIVGTLLVTSLNARIAEGDDWATDAEMLQMLSLSLDVTREIQGVDFVAKVVEELALEREVTVEELLANPDTAAALPVSLLIEAGLFLGDTENLSKEQRMVHLCLGMTFSTWKDKYSKPDNLPPLEDCSSEDSFV